MFAFFCDFACSFIMSNAEGDLNLTSKSNVALKPDGSGENNGYEPGRALEGKSVGSSSGSVRSMRQHSQIKLQLARFALKQKQEEQLEAEKLSNYHAELKSHKAQIEAEEARLVAESSTREAQRNLKLAEYEAELWEQTSTLTVEDRQVDLLAPASPLPIVTGMGVLRKWKFSMRQRIIFRSST